MRLRLEPLEPRLTLSTSAEAPALYVASLFHSLLGRDADAAGQSYWVGRLDGGAFLHDVAAALVSSREFLIDRIDDAYAQTLARPPEADALNYWLGQSEELLEIKLLASDEFFARVGENDRAFIQGAYEYLFGRFAEDAGQAHWLDELAAGMSRSDVVFQLLFSQEGVERRINGDYLRVLGRVGDPAGLAYWTQRLAAGTTNDEVLVNFALTGEYFLRETGLPITAVPEPAPFPWTMFNDQINARARQGNVDLMFIGDSNTAGWNLQGFGANTWTEFYSGRNAMEAGIPGDSTQHVLWRLEHGNLDVARPKLVVLMIGTNNIVENASPQDLAAGVRSIIDTLRGLLPQSRILLMGVMPFGETADAPSRKTVAAVNSLLINLADGNAVFYRDIGDLLLGPDGRFLPDVIHPDFAHLAEAGYRIWANAIEPTVKAFVG